MEGRTGSGAGASRHNCGRDRRAEPVPGGACRYYGFVDDIVLVEDHTLVAAMRHAHQELGVVLEPSGAAGLAALLTYRERFRGQLIGTILSGGNITVEQMQQWLVP